MRLRTWTALGVVCVASAWLAACQVEHETIREVYGEDGCLKYAEVLREVWEVNTDELRVVIGPVEIETKVSSPKPGTIIKLPDGSHGFVPENDPTHYYPITPVYQTPPGQGTPTAPVYRPRTSVQTASASPRDGSGAIEASPIGSFCDVVERSVPEVLDWVEFDPFTQQVSWIEPRPDDLPRNFPLEHLSWDISSGKRCQVTADIDGLGAAMVVGRVGRIENSFATIELQVLDHMLTSRDGKSVRLLLAFVVWTDHTTGQQGAEFVRPLWRN